MAAPSEERIAVPVDDPNADTEWNEILRKQGIIPEKPPSPTPMIEEALEEARRLAHENRLEGKDLDELAELEDEEDEDFLNQYRRRRMAEMSAITHGSIYNQVYPVQKADWSRDVTETSQKASVFVLLTSSQGTNVESRIMVEMWRELAQKFGDVKFCQIRGDLCIEGYPDKNTPTILVYKDGDIKKQVVTLREFQGVQTKLPDLERMLVDVGAVKQNDPRLHLKPDEDDDLPRKSIKTGKTVQASAADGGDGDDDWD